MYPSAGGNDKVNVRSAAHELTALGRVQGKRLREVMVECERLEEDEREKWEGMEWWGNVPEGVVDEAKDDGDVEMVDADADADELAKEGDLIVVKRHTTIGTTTPAPTKQMQPAVASTKMSVSTPAAPAAPQPTVPVQAAAAPTALPSAVTTAVSQPPQPPKPQPPPRKARLKSAPRNADDIKPTGLGAIDWLSPARRADYKKWEAGMLKRIEAIERAERGVAGKSPARVSRKRKADALEVA